MVNKMAKESQNKPTEKGGSPEPYFSALISDLFSDLTPRSQEILKKRFGIGRQNTETLEKIGKEYGITRERVRQIIVDAVKKISKKKEGNSFKNAEEKIVSTIEKNHGIIEEVKLMRILSGDNESEINALKFFGTLSGQLKIVEEKGLLKKSWISQEEILERIKEIGRVTKEIFETEKKLLQDVELTEKLIQKIEDLSHEKALNLIDVLGNVAKNRFGKWGLSHWEEVNPKGTREKIHLVLKEKGQPLHFTEIAKFIDEYGLSKKKAHPQTVHNELIKDDRFVLIGRGIYALKEWGYKPGTVKEVLSRILKESGRPLGSEEILNKVMKVRKVKRSTVMINLNNSALFIKQNNLYSVKK
ncbi:MAG: HTH domain-containing protein [Candidatus Moranbacteria bacterium]|nr:HTH domain-containing protein [Candidatus Moranbacteria bacterium]